MDPNLDAYMLSYTTSAENEGQPSNNHDANQVDSLIPSGFQGNPSPPEFINHQQNGLLHNPRRSPKSPKNQLGLEGELDLSRPDSINQQSIQVAKTPRIRPRHHLSLEGHLDFLSRPDSINRQQLAMERNPKRGKVQPTDNFGLEGHLELSRPHSINQQIHSIQRSPKMKPKDHLGPLEGLDISWPSSPNILKFKKGPKMVKPRDNFCLEGQMEISLKEWGLFDVHSKGQHLKKRPSQDTLDFTTKNLQRCELESRNQNGRNNVATRKPKDTISLPSATGMEYQRRTNIYEAYDGTSRPLRIKPKDTLLLEGPREWPSSSFKSQAIASSPGEKFYFMTRNFIIDITRMQVRRKCIKNAGYTFCQK